MKRKEVFEHAPYQMYTQLGQYERDNQLLYLSQPVAWLMPCYRDTIDKTGAIFNQKYGFEAKSSESKIKTENN